MSARISGFRSVRRSAAMVSAFAILALAACQNETTKAGGAGTPPPPADNTAPTQPVADTAPQRPTTLAAALGGEGARLVFDQCDMTDSESWTGETDVLGSFVCGREYLVRFDAASAAWVVTGPRELDPADPANLQPYTKATPGSAPSEGVMFLWGGRYTFDANGLVFRRGEEQPIGKLSF